MISDELDRRQNSSAAQGRWLSSCPDIKGIWWQPAGVLSWELSGRWARALGCTVPQDHDAVKPSGPWWVKSLTPSDTCMRHQINHHWFRQWLVAWPAPSHYLNHAGMLLIGPLGTNFSEILVGIHTFSFKRMHLKMSSGKWRHFCISLGVLNTKVCGVCYGWPKNCCRRK